MFVSVDKSFNTGLLAAVCRCIRDLLPPSENWLSCLAFAYSPFICTQLQITSSVAAYGKNCNETRVRQAQMNGLSLAGENEILLYSNMK